MQDVDIVPLYCHGHRITRSSPVIIYSYVLQLLLEADDLSGVRIPSIYGFLPIEFRTRAHEYSSRERQLEHVTVKC